MLKQKIFTLTPEHLQAAHEVIKHMKDNNLAIGEFKTKSLKLVIVKDGTAESEARKDITLGPVDYHGEQYLITFS